ncbi:MAG: porin [Burkholderiales bacterium]|nr:porin [Burkholderiales bacterium]
MQTVSSAKQTARLAAICLICALLAPWALADDAEPTQRMLTFNGFGTLGVAHSSEHRADYTFDNLQPKGAGRSSDWSPEVDTRLGGQLTANFTPQWSAVLQVVSEYRWNNTYDPFVSWANVKYAFTPDFSVRVGRIALASFLESDSRRVGYSNITARPPIEVYRLLALKESDGIDAVYRTHFDGMTNSTTVLFGKRTVTNTRGIDVHSTHVAGLFDTLEFGATTLHGAYQVRNVDNQAPSLGRFMSLGISHDPGNWFMASEWVKAVNFDGKGVRVDRLGWYINGGVRIGNFSPYATWSELLPTTPTGTTPAGQRTLAPGVRWDLAHNVDLKLQYDMVRLADQSYGTLQNVKAGTPKGGKVNVLSLVADFVF